MTDDEVSVTVEDAAQRLGCDHSTVRKLVRGGKLPAHRVGRAIRIKVGAIRQYETDNAVEPDGENKAPGPRRRRSHSAGYMAALERMRQRGIVA
jgi:excisionase family DNA binding protein